MDLVKQEEAVSPGNLSEGNIVRQGGRPMQVIPRQPGEAGPPECDRSFLVNSEARG